MPKTVCHTEFLENLTLLRFYISARYDFLHSSKFTIRLWSSYFHEKLNNYFQIIKNKLFWLNCWRHSMQLSLSTSVSFKKNIRSIIFIRRILIQDLNSETGSRLLKCKVSKFSRSSSQVARKFLTFNLNSCGESQLNCGLKANPGSYLSRTQA